MPSASSAAGNGFTYRCYRWMTDLPLRDGKDAMADNWLELEISNPAGEVTNRNSFITDLPVGRDAAAELAACGRARRKIENETFNFLNTGGYHLEHNSGHGQNNLAALLATLHLMACFSHRLRPRRRGLAGGQGQSRFRNLAAITSFLLVPGWDDLMRTLIFAQPPPRPP